MSSASAPRRRPTARVREEVENLVDAVARRDTREAERIASYLQQRRTQPREASPPPTRPKSRR